MKEINGMKEIYEEAMNNDLGQYMDNKGYHLQVMYTKSKNKIWTADEKLSRSNYLEYKNPDDNIWVGDIDFEPKDGFDSFKEEWAKKTEEELNKAE